jgi:hypothetical protein
MPGPLPTGEAARRHKPTIPTTTLPASGRSDPPPPCPYELGPKGKRWWDAAWVTPQAAGWSDGDAYFVARRAELEDHPERNPTIHRVMTDMDDRLGLTPKGMAALRWKIVDDAEAKPRASGSEKRKLKLVDKAR